jgi:hypothetical protein
VDILPVLLSLLGVPGVVHTVVVQLVVHYFVNKVVLYALLECHPQLPVVVLKHALVLPVVGLVLLQRHYQQSPGCEVYMGDMSDYLSLLSHQHVVYVSPAVLFLIKVNHYLIHKPR